MSSNHTTTELLRQFVKKAYQFGNVGQEDAGIIMLRLARSVTGKDEVEIKDYVMDLKRAGWAAFGHDWSLADLSKRKQIEALHYWAWFRDLTGERLEDCLEIAVGVMKQDDVTWVTRKELIQNCLDNHPVRRDLISE